MSNPPQWDIDDLPVDGPLTQVAVVPSSPMASFFQWDPTGKLIFWNSGRKVRTARLDPKRTPLEGWSGEGFGSVGLSTTRPQEIVVATGDKGGAYQAWDLQDGRPLWRVESHSEVIHVRHVAALSGGPAAYALAVGSGVALVSGEGQVVTQLSISAPADYMQVFATREGDKLAIWTIHGLRIFEPPNVDPVLSVSAQTLSMDALSWADWSADGSMIVLAGGTNAAVVLDTTGAVLVWLEGHTAAIYGVAFSPDGRLLATASDDETVRLWDVGSWRCLAVLAVHSQQMFGSIAFHPKEPLLACRSPEAIRILRFEPDRLSGTRRVIAPRRYVNAKVLLVGDSGVGKSGLGLVLSGQPYVPTESTHARRVATSSVEEHPVEDGVETRETLLWDLCGQPGYRLVHQLHLAQAALAIVVFDARNDADPFAGVRYWVRALQNARRRAPASAPLRTILVAARADRGGVPVPRARIDELVAELGIEAYVETSAREGWGLEELRTLIRDTLPWGELPWAASTELFDTIKRFLLEERGAGRGLVTEEDLFRTFVRQQPGRQAADGLRASFATCIGLLESRDLLRRLTFGGQVLLRPELLDSYASAIVDAARSEPDGLGFVPEADVLAGNFRMAADERLDDVGEERLLLLATVEELLRHDLALREVSDGVVDLVFPSQFTRTRPEPGEPVRLDVEFTFEGEPRSVYASLVVRLTHADVYVSREFFHDSALFTPRFGGRCGIVVLAADEGSVRLGLFFEPETSAESRVLFEDYVHAHLVRRALPESLTRRRIFRCPDPECGYEVDAVLAGRWQSKGITDKSCPACDETTIRLDDRTPGGSGAVERMNAGADRQRDLAVAETTIRKRTAGTFDVFLSYGSKDRDAVRKVAERLRLRGILPWFDEWDLAPGADIQDELEQQIRSVPAVAVILGPRGLGPWQDREQKGFIQRRIKGGARIVPVILQGVEGDDPLPPFLSQWRAVDFRVPDPDPFEQLVWGVTGERAPDW